MMRPLILFVGVAGLLAACGSATERTFTDEPVGFNLSLDSGEQLAGSPYVTASEEASSPLMLTSATVNVKEIAFKAGPGVCDGDDGEARGDDGVVADTDRVPDGIPLTKADTGDVEDESSDDTQSSECAAGFVVVSGPFQIDLLTGASSPSLDSIEFSPGSYRWVDLRLAPVSDATDPMNGKTLVAHGEYSNGTTVPVRLALTIGEPPMRIQPAGGIVIEQEGGVDISVILQERDWFKGIDDDLNMCAESESASYVDGVLQITGTSGGACDRVNGTLRQNFIGAGASAPVAVDSKR